MPKKDLINQRGSIERGPVPRAFGQSESGPGVTVPEGVADGSTATMRRCPEARHSRRQRVGCCATAIARRRQSSGRIAEITYADAETIIVSGIELAPQEA